MADISAEITAVQQASRGEAVRDSIVAALQKMNNGIASTVSSALEQAKESGDFDGPQGPAGTNGINGTNGTDGVSPTVTIAAIMGGHRVTITDAAHPNGQSFDVTDGADGATGATGPQGPQGETGATGADGADGEDGTNGISPTITIATITGGHRVTITDAAHPNGQSFDVMDGSGGSGVGGSGDMQTSIYDPNNNVSAAGGIEAYFNANAQSSLTFDNAPTQGSDNPVKSGGIYNAVASRQASVWRTTVNLTANWSGNGPYTQTVSINGVTANSLIDIQPSSAVIAQMLADGVGTMWIENDNGTITVKTTEAALSEPVSLQCIITETGTVAPASYANHQEVTDNKVTSITIASTNQQYPSAAAVWTLFNSITNANGVSY